MIYILSAKNTMPAGTVELYAMFYSEAVLHQDLFFLFFFLDKLLVWCSTGSAVSVPILFSSSTPSPLLLSPSRSSKVTATVNQVSGTRSRLSPGSSALAVGICAAVSLILVAFVEREPPSPLVRFCSTIRTHKGCLVIQRDNQDTSMLQSIARNMKGEGIFIVRTLGKYSHRLHAVAVWCVFSEGYSHATQHETPCGGQTQS